MVPVWVKKCYKLSSYETRLWSPPLPPRKRKFIKLHCKIIANMSQTPPGKHNYPLRTPLQKFSWSVHVDKTLKKNKTNFDQNTLVSLKGVWSWFYYQLSSEKRDTELTFFLLLYVKKSLCFVFVYTCWISWHKLCFPSVTWRFSSASFIWQYF